MRKQPRLWMDITTTIRSLDRINGTTRVEHSLAKELYNLFGDRLAFCTCSPSSISPATYNPLTTETSPTSTQTLRGLGTSSQKSQRWDRRLERSLRHHVRSNIKRLTRFSAQDPFPASSTGDCLFLPGETWSARHDFSLLSSLRKRKGLKLAALCQDLIPVTDPQFFQSEHFISRFRQYVDFLLYETDVVIAISQSTARELERLRNASGSSRVEVITLGSDFDHRPPSPPPNAADLSGRDYVLSVSTIQARKNFDLLYRVWRRLAAERGNDCPRLIIVGQRGFGSDDLLWQIEHDPLTKDCIKVFHAITDTELSWLYTNCAFTVYPSFAEGWGLPISESLHRGKVCIASNTTSMPEAGQGICILLDPIDTLGWYNLVVSLIDDPTHVAKLESNIKQRYRPRTWGDAAGDFAKLLSELASPQPHRPAI